MSLFVSTNPRPNLCVFVVLRSLMVSKVDKCFPDGFFLWCIVTFWTLFNSYDYLIFLYFFQYIVDGPDEDVLDYGTVGVRENRTITFKIINKNPVEVSYSLILLSHAE